ncbi:hypothetical protein ACU4HD_14165 [Cupriavidus basilensis]
MILRPVNVDSMDEAIALPFTCPTKETAEEEASETARPLARRAAFPQVGPL